MGNMSYCRFTNTLEDLRDCQEFFEDPIDNRDEHNARHWLLKICCEIAESYDLDDPEFARIPWKPKQEQEGE